jgi:penicillin-binding protein 1A
MFAKENRKITLSALAIVLVAVIGGTLLGLNLASTSNLKKMENFTDFNPALPSKILDIRGDLITEFASEEKRELITLEDVSPNMIHAILAREDRTFYEHKGFTAKSIMRAIYGKLTNQTLGGGSTITQQVAGTLYLDRTDISISRKVKELWWSLQLERRYSKDEILELYINKMYFGGGVYGVNAASKFFFGHSASEITAAEAAILVIQLSNPAYYNPFEHPNRAMERQKAVLDAMVGLKYLTREEADKSFDDYWLTFDLTRTGSSAWLARNDKARWFSEYVLRELSNLIYGTMDIYSDGFTVHTTLDLRHQAAADAVMKDTIALANKRFKNSSAVRFEQGDEYARVTELLSLAFDLPQLAVSGQRLNVKSMAYYRKAVNPVVDMMSLVCGLDALKLQTNKSNALEQKAAAKTTVEGALVTLENDTGYITALVGGSKFDESNQLIRATQGAMQPGSTFKPLYYSAAIDSQKYTEGTMISDTPVVFYNEEGVPYTPLNFKGEWKGTVLLWEALANSMNVPSLKILDGIGFDAAINRAASLIGVTDPAEIKKKFPRVYPIGLGVIDVNPLQMAKAFSTFANQGKEVTPIAIRSIEDRNGKTIVDPEKEVRLAQKRKGSAIQIVSPQNAYIMTDLLKNTIRAGTLGWASGYESKFTFKDEKGKSFTIPAAGKTGTTQNWADAWTVGFTPYYTTAVWFGFDKRGYSLGLDNTGAVLAGPAWAEYMHEIHAGLPYRDFVKPQTGLVSATVCKKSGLLPTANCDEGTITLLYLEGTQPRSYCEYHDASGELKRRSMGILQTESFAVGQKPIEVDGGDLLLDPSLFEDPKPSSAALRAAGKSDSAYTGSQGMGSQGANGSQGATASPQTPSAQPSPPPTSNPLLE